MTDIRDRLQKTLGSAYRLDRELGGGGMSRVFVAEEKRLGRLVVVKVLAADLAAGVSAERFEREIRLAAQLQHPNIVPLLAAGEVEGLPYYTMPFVDGPSIRARLSAGAIPLNEAVSILRDVAKALAYAHRRQVVHRDIKPENVLLSADTAVVTDFGIARALTRARGEPGGGGGGGGATDRGTASALTAHGMSLGTPAYMAPEQAAGDPDVEAQADVYAFGVMAYELLAGRHPFADKTTVYQLITAHLLESPEPLETRAPAVPRPFTDLVRRCLSKDPADRPENGAAVLDAIEAMRTAGRTAWAAAARVEVPIAAAVTPTVAVLPFANLSSDPENEYLSDGITEEIIGTLGRLRTVRVAGRASSFALKGQKLDPRTVGERLNVSSLVEGSVRRVGNRVRVTVELVDVADGFQRWSERYDRDLDDIFAVQDEIAQSIAGSLSARLVTPSAQLDRAVPAVNLVGDPEAYRLYLLARHTLRRLDPDAMDRVLDLADRALAIDPRMAPAYVVKAVAYNNLAIFSVRPPHEVFPLAREAALAALALDPTRAEARTILAQIAFAYDWDGTGAEDVYERALAADPSDTGTLSRAAMFHAAVQHADPRHVDEAVRLVRQAMDVDPLSAWVHFVAGTVLWLVRRYDEAMAVTRHALELDPHHALSVMTLGSALREAGHLDEAIVLLERALVLTGRNPLALANAAIGHVRLGDPARATSYVDEMISRSATQRVSPVFLAQALGWLNRHDEAFRWLEQSVADRDYWVVMLGADPLADPLRDDPRFAAVMRRTGVPLP